ncbi:MULTISPECIES: Lsr2 family protein [unclassified Pseudonocardia]|uniref:histone-like nucleoid-structuring protein Lsr2 n=1 Tax=unclassified Pseudonocardia TaxID=2619320 RepID=UPI0007615F2B|nr:Histone protein Lsr2 [Pseudonocardia sp. Ae707_Ps1]
MAKVETVRLVDDISGDEADETVDFGLDGRRFRIDLTSAHARALREGLAPFLGAARSAGSARDHGRTAPAATPGGAGAGSAGAAPGAEGSGAAVREHNRAVREWARENGFTVSERGRIPSEVAEAYRRDEAAASGTTAGTTTTAGTKPARTAGPTTTEPAAEKPATTEASAVEQAPEPVAAPATRQSTAPAVEFSG